MAHIICIDPGHGGSDSGAVGNGLYEKNLTLTVGTYLNEYLTADANYSPVLTRSGDRYVSVNQRAALGRQANAELFAAIHFNSASGSTGKGLEVYPKNPAEAYHSESVTFAKAVVTRMKDIQTMRGVDACGIRYAYLVGGSNVMAEFTDTNPNGYQSYYGVLRQAQCPAVLIETAFINNPNDIKNFQTDEQLKAVALRYYKAICDYFGTIPVGEEGAGQPEEGSAVLYKVQLGAFENKANAQALAQELEGKGYTAYLVKSNK